MPSKVKITVVRKLTTSDVFGSDVPCQSNVDNECVRLKLGDVFVVPEDGSFPQGFCAWAYHDIFRDITHLRFGGDYPFCKEKGTAVQCCTDGLRPVFFKLERVD